MSDPEIIGGNDAPNDAILAALARGLTAEQVADLDFLAVCELAGVDAQNIPAGWSYEAVRAIVANTLCSMECEARRQAAREAAELAAREILPSAEVEVRG